MRNKKFITLMMCFLLSCASVGVMSACNKDKGKDSASSNGSSVGVSSPADSSSESSKVIEYKVSGNKLEVIDIPTGYTHNIENIGETDMVTVMWANEPFNPEKPDTYFEEV